MDVIIKKMLGGGREAFYELYSSVKSEIAFLANALCPEKASEVIKSAVTDSFQAAIEGKLTENTVDEFSSFATSRALELCKKYTLEEDPAEFDLPELGDEKLTSVIEENIDPARGAMNYALALPTIPKWVLTLRIFCSMDNSEIAGYLSSGADYVDSIIKYEYESLENIYRFVTRRGGKCIAPTKELIKVEFDDIAASTSIPESAQSRIDEYILQRSDEPRKKLNVKKLLMLVIPVLVIVVAIIVGVSVFRAKKMQEETEAIENVVTLDIAAIKEDGGIAVTEVPEALDENYIYFADITIADHGTLTVMLDHAYAPITTANFIKRSVEGFYDNLTFHRIINGYMMQGGDPLANSLGGSDENIVGEFVQNGHPNYLSHVRGAISMARASDYDSASSQFFIVHNDSTFLDGQYAAFGYVVNGMSIVDDICTSAKPTDGNGTIPKEEQPVMTSVSIWCAPYEVLMGE